MWAQKQTETHNISHIVKGDFQNQSSVGLNNNIINIKLMMMFGSMLDSWRPSWPRLVRMTRMMMRRLEDSTGSSTIIFWT